VEVALINRHPPIDIILDDLEVKPLIVAGEPGNGKTVFVKRIAEEARRRGWVIQAFDPSLAWYHDSPLANRATVEEGEWGYARNEADTCYDVSGLTPEERRLFTARIIKEQWDRRVEAVKVNPYYLDDAPIHLFILEEGNTFWSSSSLNRRDWAGASLTDFVSIRRNLRFAAIVVTTAVSGEIATRYRRRCNYLLSRVMSYEERSYLKKSTSRDTVEAASTLPRFKFIYYGGTMILEPFSVPYKKYPTPTSIDVNPFIEAVTRGVENRRGGWGLLGRLVRYCESIF